MTIATNFAGAASRAYQAGQSLPAARSLADKAEGPSFEEMVQQSAKAVVQAVHAGDKAAVAGLRGEMSVQQVVEATRSMETALQVTLAVRNKVVEAYTEVLRMSV